MAVESLFKTVASDGLANELLVEVENLSLSFRSDEGLVKAVERVDFTVRKGKTLGIVGESGSGKSVSTKALMTLLPSTAILGEASRMLFRTKSGDVIDIAKLPRRGEAVRHLRGGEISMIFQEPMASFSPVYSIGNQIMEAVLLHRKVDRAGAYDIAIEMLKKVGLSNPEMRLKQFPHELSGGMRQRAMIACALATSPALLIADEPTTALDVTIQAQILELMNDLRRELGMSIIFITHDMGVIAQVADEVAVMYLGTVVERGTTAQVVKEPKHPYTVGLLNAIPRLDRLDGRLKPIPGDIPSPMNRPPGCPFQTRCPKMQPGRCDRIMPAETEVGGGHLVRCLLYED